MPRTARLKSTTGTYHVLLRAQKKRGIFRKESDYAVFTQIMKDTQQPAGQQAPLFYVEAYCLMPGYVHLLIKEGTDKIANAMRRVMVQYAAYYNEEYNTYGRVFYDRFRSEPCDSYEYQCAVANYIHNNPVKYHLCESPADYPWSSYQQNHERFAAPAENAPEVQLTEERRVMMTDYRVRKRILQLCRVDSIEQFRELDKRYIRTALAMLRKKGASLGQLVRVTGCTINVVRKARVLMVLPERHKKTIK